MKLKGAYILVLGLILLANLASAKSNKNRGYLHLKGVVPVQTSVNFTYNKDGVLVPTLNSNAAQGSHHLPKVRVLRAPASFGGAEKVVISTP